GGEEIIYWIKLLDYSSGYYMRNIIQICCIISIFSSQRSETLTERIHQHPYN
uniref:Uncharacterized protein n=1 Tax=Aegilops tauschii subsp. strangulata TaxID=200361 RepID=A0A453CDT3_AEGTS